MNRSKNAPAIVAEICLYGSSDAAGWLAHAGPLSSEGLLGDGEPREGRTLNDATWLALDALRKAGTTRGLVQIVEPRGKLAATTEISNPWQWFGDLEWRPAPVYVIEADAIIAAAE